MATFAIKRRPNSVMYYLFELIPTFLYTIYIRIIVFYKFPASKLLLFYVFAKYNCTSKKLYFRRS